MNSKAYPTEYNLHSVCIDSFAVNLFCQVLVIRIYTNVLYLQAKYRSCSAIILMSNAIKLSIPPFNKALLFNTSTVYNYFNLNV